jgi:hypothetical protein
VEMLKVDQIRAELVQHEEKVQMQTKFVEKYIDAVQNQIEECKGFVRKYSIDMLMVSEDMQKFCRQYKSNLDDNNLKTENVAKMVLSLTECMLIE